MVTRFSFRPLLAGACGLALAACAGLDAGLPWPGRTANESAVAGDAVETAPPVVAETASETPTAITAPRWAQHDSDVPADPAVIFGQMDNGMRYAVLRNATPPEQVSLRLHIRAGSLMEDDDQLGLAHFIEHMAFNGSTNFPEGELIRELQRVGLAFGPDTNAFTSFEQTVYQLDLPRAEAETLDLAFRVLRDMAGEATLNIEAIDRERGVVISEERTRDGPGMRAARARSEFFMPGQRPTVRFPIGDPEVLRTAPRERFADFYSTWYRPERAAIIAVGDFDPAEMEARIRAAFGDWVNPAPDRPDPEPGPVLPRESEARIFVDPGASHSVQIAWTAPPDLERDHLERRRLNIIRSLGFAVLNRRLTQLAREEAPPFISASAGRSNNQDAIDVTAFFASVQPGRWAEALTVLDQEQRRLVAYGVSESELRREIAERRASYATYVAGAGTRRTPALANGLTSTLNSDAVFTSPETELLIFESVIDDLDADLVNTVMREAMNGQGPLVFVTSATEVEGGEAAVLAAFEASRAIAVEPPAAEDAPEWPYTDFGASGAVVERREIADLETTVAVFANGVTLTVKPTTFRNDQILVSVNVGDGASTLPSDRITPVWGANSAVIEGGLGRLTTEQMQQALAANVYRAGFSVGSDAYTLSGATRPADFVVQMQVLAAYLTDPGWRPEAFERVRGVLAQSYDQMRATPGGVFGRYGSELLMSGDARARLPEPEEVPGASLAELRGLIEEGLAAGPIEIVIVGEIDVETAIAVTASTFGALPPRGASLEQHLAVRFPAPTAEPVTLNHAGRADQGLAFVAWPAVDFIEDLREARLVRLLSDVLRLRLLDELRENQGVTYSPSAGASASTVYPGYGYLSASIQAPPDRLDGFFRDVDAIAATLASDPIDQDELERARRPRIEQIWRSRNTNETWLGELEGLAGDEAERLRAIRSAVADLERITPADIQRAARDYLKPDTAWRLVVTPGTQAPAAE